jgi:23S rRNA (uracil1939-C5)-methyltransferase
MGGAPVLHEVLKLPMGQALRFEIHPRAFFQPNTLQAEVLYAKVVEAAQLDGGSQRVLDLYCGTGTIGLCLSPYCASVTGVELVADAVDNARRNASHNGLSNVTFHAGDAGDVLSGALAGQTFDLVVVDPPRSGLKTSALEQLAALGIPRLVYVSCSPASLARDLRLLLGRGYVLDGPLEPVDMFPHTPHVETVARLVRAGGEA